MLHVKIKPGPYHAIPKRQWFKGSAGKESSCNAGDPGSIPGWGRSPGKGNGNPPQYSCLGNPWIEESGRIQPMGSKRVGYNLATKHACAQTHTHKGLKTNKQKLLTLVKIKPFSN